MSRDDEQFEDYLREFLPRRPVALSVSETAGGQWRRFAAAAAIVVAVGASVWFGQRKRLETPLGTAKPIAGTHQWVRGQVTLGQLGRLANDPDELDAALVSASRKELPDFRESSSALRALAKE